MTQNPVHHETVAFTIHVGPESFEATRLDVVDVIAGGMPQVYRASVAGLSREGARVLYRHLEDGRTLECKRVGKLLCTFEGPTPESMEGLVPLVFQAHEFRKT
jgi:hypothetical protein